MTSAQHKTYGVPIRLGSLSTAEVAESPGGIAEHAQLAAVAKQVKQWLQSAAAQDVVATVGAVASDVAQSPYGLLADIGLGAGEELDEDRNGIGLDDDLGLSGRARGNVGQGPRSLELNKGMRRTQELNEAADDTCLDDLLNRWVALL